MNPRNSAAAPHSVAFPDSANASAGTSCEPSGDERPHVGLLILFGPEVRAFLYSGLAERLARRARVSVITARPDSAVFAALQRDAVHAAPHKLPSYPLTRFRGWNRRLHDAWLQAQGDARWRQQSPATAPPVCTGLPRQFATNTGNTSFPSWLRTANRIESTLARLSGDGKSWESLVERLGLDCLVTADYASPAAAAALLAAARCDAATVVLTNSWKDVFTHPYIGALPDWVGVAGRAEAEHLLRTSPHLGGDRIAVTGSLHLERFLRPGGLPGRVEFCAAAGLDPARPFVCYTAASPGAVAVEEAVVSVLLEVAEGHPAQPQVLLRLNPRESGERFRPLQERFADCVVQKPRWEWDAENDWNAPLREDLDTWVAAVLHAAFNVSIPSTVTLEFAAMGRSTLNVCFDCFDAGGQSAQVSNARFWDAPFYRQIRSSPLVAGAFSEQQFREMLDCRLCEPQAWSTFPARPIATPVDEAEKLVWSAIDARVKSVTSGSARRLRGQGSNAAAQAILPM